MSILVLDRFKNMKRRTLIRIASFFVAFIVLLIGVGVYGFVLAGRYRMKLEHTYQRALNELGTNVSNIDIALNKGLYANTPAQMVVLSNKLAREANNAKASLGQLPTQGLELTNTSKFLSQIGEFSMTLVKKVVNQEEITEEERAQLDKLTEMAGAMREEIDKIQTELNEGNLTIGRVENLINFNDKNGDEQVREVQGLDAGFQDIENSFEDYPTLIYDGPFSDHIFQREPLMTKGAPEITAGQAQQKAADFTGIPFNSLKKEHDEGGNMPSYVFSADGNTVSVTKAGGEICYFLKTRDIGSPTIDQAKAVKIATDFLASKGIGPMAESYYQTTNNICTINFAYMQNNVKCYTDLIKVSVALDNGEIVGYDARGFIMNHTQRDLGSPAISIQDAQANLSERLKVVSSGLAVIPSSGLNEIYCYEFKCKGKNDEDVIVYVNVKTGNEEQILILQHTEGGTLAY